MTIKITKKLAESELRRLGREFPDKVVSQCTYVHKGRPNCIVGKLLVDNGVDPKVFTRRVKGKKLNTGPYSSIKANKDYSPNGLPLNVIVPAIKSEVEFTPGALTVLSAVQTSQDFGYRWSLAVARAVKK